MITYLKGSYYIATKCNNCKDKKSILQTLEIPKSYFIKGWECVECGKINKEKPGDIIVE